MISPAAAASGSVGQQQQGMGAPTPADLSALSALTALSAPNPFAMPSDEQVFVLREEERRRREAERERLLHRRVYEKTTWSNRIGSARAKTTLTDAELGISASAAAASVVVASPGGEGGTTATAAGSAAASTKEGMNIAAFIAKKREMGLTRMALATKRHEIRKLEEEAERAERKVKQQEEQLEETIRKFEDFLKDNDIKANEAMKRAEIETKGKQEKTAEIKKLSAQIAAINNEKMKYEEQMQSCLRYKKFLDQRTPVQWFRETLCNIEMQRVRDELERELEEVTLPKIREAMMAAEEAAAAAATANTPASGPAASLASPTSSSVQQQHQQHQARFDAEVARASAAVDAKVSELRAQARARLEEVPDAAILSELNVLDPDIVPMFFTEAERILNIFMDIEENNLFLIQNCQETEESLEELKTKFGEDKVQMDEEAASLKSQIEAIKQKIAVEEQKKKALLQRTTQSREAQAQVALLSQIHASVTSIFKDSGFGDNDANLGTVGMLTKVEAKLEELQAQITALPGDFVSVAMKHRDKERRQRARQKLLDEQRLSREERSQKALARSQAPVRKRVGKTVMWRSRPVDQKKAEEVRQEDSDDVDDAEFFM